MGRVALLMAGLALAGCLRESRMQIRVSASRSNSVPIEDIVLLIGERQSYPVPALRPGESQEVTVSLRDVESLLFDWRAGSRRVSWEGPDLDATQIRELHLLVELEPDPKHPVRHRLVRR